jgi:hypothetical protein
MKGLPHTARQPLPWKKAHMTQQQYRQADWERLGRAISRSRSAEKLSMGALGAAIRSSSKSVLRIEAGRIHGDPRTAPPGDYNSERYVLRRLALLEMALGWPQGHAQGLLEQGRKP